MKALRVQQMSSETSHSAGVKIRDECEYIHLDLINPLILDNFGIWVW